MILGYRQQLPDVIGIYSDTATDGLYLAVCRRTLTSGHGDGFIVRDNHRNVTILIDGIEKTRYSGVSESRVADYRHSREQAGIGSPFGHRDRCTHIHAGIDGFIRRQSPKRITSDIGEDTSVGIFCKNLVQRIVHIAVATAFAQGGRTCRNEIGDRFSLYDRYIEGFCHMIRIQLSITGQCAIETTFDPLQTGEAF